MSKVDHIEEVLDEVFAEYLIDQNLAKPTRCTRLGNGIAEVPKGCARDSQCVDCNDISGVNALAKGETWASAPI